MTDLIRFENFDISNIDDDSFVCGKTIREMKEKDIRWLILSVSKMKPSPLRDYLDKWIFEHYYEKKIKKGNLTYILKNSINNKISYREVMKRCFDGIDILQNKKSVKNILNPETLHIIQRMHSLSPHLSGTFLDYLARRFISELLNKEFRDHRAESFCHAESVVISDGDYDTWQFRTNGKYGSWIIRDKPTMNGKTIIKMSPGDKFVVLEKNEIWLKIFYKNVIGWVRHKVPDCEDFHLVNNEEFTGTLMDNPYLVPFEQNFHYCQYGCCYKIEHKLFNTIEDETDTGRDCILPICKNLAYALAKDTKNYATEDILPDLFIASLSHTEAFMGCPSPIVVYQMTFMLKNEHVAKMLSQGIKELCQELIQDKQNILLNPGLGKILKNGKRGIPADCDLVIDDTLFDFKCTKGNESDTIYEIEQLLGYTSLLRLAKDDPVEIKKICILNLLKGEYKEFNIDYLQDSHLEKYLDLIHKS